MLTNFKMLPKTNHRSETNYLAVFYMDTHCPLKYCVGILGLPGIC